METLLSFKEALPDPGGAVNDPGEDFEVEFDVVTSTEPSADGRLREIAENLEEIDGRIAAGTERVRALDSEIDRLTNHADGLDYMVAVASGIIAGVIDSVWVGEFSIDRANSWGDEKVNHFVVKVAQSRGYKGEDLEGAIRFLEGHYGLASDSLTPEFGGGRQHHLRDFAHHPTPCGLLFSLLTQFTGKAYGTDTNGMFLVCEITNREMIGRDIPQKILFGVVYWVFHMVSDMAGSSTNAGAGTGLPGPLVSILKELSVLPFFKNININDMQLSVWISKLFNGTLLARRDEAGKITEKVKFDLRTEIGVAHELGRQALPVVINECIVRGFYFIRRFFFELRDKKVRSLKDLGQIDWQKTLPAGNRTIVRMLTISTGTFTAIDLADAAVRSAVKSGGVAAPAFLANMALRVNFVGIGRFVVALGTDVGMGIRRGRLRNERMRLHTELIALSSAKVFYRQADMWIAAESAGAAIEKAYDMMEKTTAFWLDSMREMEDNLDKIGRYVPEARMKNAGLLEDIEDILTWG